MEQKMNFIGDAYRNEVVTKAEETIKLPIPFYNVTLSKEALKKIKSDENGMINLSIHMRSDVEPNSKKPNCFIIERNSNIIDIHSVKDFSLKKSEVMGLPTKDFTNSEGNTKQSICLLITSNGDIKFNNKAVGIESESPTISGKAYEVNTLARKNALVKKIENTEKANDPKFATIIKEINSIAEFVGTAYEKKNIKEGEISNRFCNLSLNRQDIATLPTDNYGNIKLDIIARKEVGKDGSSHFIIPSTSTYKGFLNPNAEYEIKVPKDEIMNPNLIQVVNFKNKEGKDVSLEKINLTITSDEKLVINKGIYENNGIDVTNIQLNGNAKIIDSNQRKELLNQKKESDTQKKTTEKKKGLKI